MNFLKDDTSEDEELITNCLVARIKQLTEQ